MGSKSKYYPNNSFSIELLYGRVCSSSFGKLSPCQEPGPELNQACRSVTGCLKSTNVEDLYLLSGIAPPAIRRDVCARMERQKETTRWLHKAGGGLITLIRDNITFTTTDIPSTINTHNIELQMVKVHINNTKHITIANIYIPPRDTTSTHYKTADTDIQHCIQYITNIPHSFLTGDVNAHSTLWHSYTDDHRGQLIADVISNSDHITLNTNTPTRVPNTTLQQTSSPDITTVSNTLYNRTSWTTQHALSSDHLPIITTINIRHDYRTTTKPTDLYQLQESRLDTIYRRHKSPLSLRPQYPPTYTLPTEFSQTSY